MDRSGDPASDGTDDVLSADDLAALLGTAGDGLAVLDADGTVRAVPDPFPRAGVDPALVGTQLTDLLADAGSIPEDFDVASTTVFRSSVLDGDGGTVTVPLEGADGSVVSASLSVVPRSDSDGFVCLFRAVDGDAADGSRRDGNSASLSGGGTEGPSAKPDRDDPSSSAGDGPEDASTIDEGPAAFERLPDPTYVLDSTGRLVRVNDAMVEYTGYEREAMVGRPIAEIVPTRAADRIPDAPGDGTAATVETSLITDDGDLVEVEAHVVARPDGGAIGVLRDVGERKQRERDLELLKQVLTRVLRHNVRNELSVARGHAELLDEQVDDELRRHTVPILEKAQQLLDHSEKALLIEKVIGTDQRYEHDLSAVVDGIVDEIRDEHPSVTVDVDVPEAVSVDAHPDIGRAIRELLVNAVEHGPEGTRVDVWLDSRSDGRTLFVEDESGGLDDHEITVLRRGTERDLEHVSGVGLWLVRWIVEYSQAEMIVHRTEEGTLMGIRFGARDRTAGASSADIGTTPLARAPGHVRKSSLDRVHGDTVVGRSDELHELEQRYDALERTGGHVVLVTGEPGIGKSTLVDQFRERLSETEAPPTVARAVCEDGAQPPYHPFGQLFDGLSTDRDVGELFSDVGAAAEDTEDLQQRRRALFADVAEALRGVASDGPVVLVVEDMHRADGGTVDLFEYLVEEVGRWGHPVMFLGTFGTGDADLPHPVLDIVDGTVAAGRGTVLELDPLDESEVRTLLSHVLDVESVPASFVRAVHDHTGGTPLFVDELARHLDESFGPLSSGDDLPETLDAIPVPETVDSAIADRLASLPETVRSVLELGAVLGRTFSFDVLRAASDLPVDQLVDHIDTLVVRQVWTRSADGIEFVHGVVRERTLASIDPDDRTRFHERAADAIESVHGDDIDEHAGRLGTHHAEIGAVETAFEYYRRAGDVAAAAYAHDEAIEHYERAIELADDHGVTAAATLATVHADLGEVFHLVGEYDRARECFERSLDIARNADDRSCEAAALNRLGRVASARGAYDSARDRFEESLDIASEIGERGCEADCLNRLGKIAYRRGEYGRASERHERSLDRFRAIDDRTGEAECLSNLGTVAARQGEFDRAREYYEESLEIARAIDDRPGEADALHNLGIVADIHGAHDRAREYYEESLEIRRALGDRHGEATGLNELGNLVKNQGEYERARAHYEESLEIRRELGDRHGEASSLHNLGNVARARGEYDRAREYYERSLEIERDIGNRSGEAESLYNLGRIAVARGEYNRAREFYDEGLEVFRDLGDRFNEAIVLNALGDLAIRREGLGRGQEYFEDALRIAREIDAPKPEITALRELGRVARLRGDLEAATSYLSEGLECCDEDNVQQRAETLLERARVVLDRDDPDAARDAVREAREAMSGTEMPYDEAHARRLLGRIAATNGHSDDARAHWTDALETFQSVGAPEEILTTLRSLVETCSQDGDDDAADEWLETAVAAFEEAPEPVRERHEGWIEERTTGQ